MPYYDFFNHEVTLQLNLDLHNLGLKEINPTICGMEENPPGNFWGPGFRASYHIHFVTAGKGIFENSFGKFEVSAGQGFFFIPGERVYYCPDDNDPWTYIWIGFTGSAMTGISKKTGLSPSNPVFSFDKYFDIQTDFANLQYMKSGREYYCISILCRLFSSLCSEKDITAETKIETAVNYIIQNISDNISVDSLAQKFEMDRRYFSRVFNAQLKVSPQQFIINTRMTTALDLLKQKPVDATIADIARSVGYNDPLAFSKAFKRFYNLTPTEVVKGNFPDIDHPTNKNKPFRQW